jgi:3-oxoacyl-[acyl-carrier-protein] synthase II
MTSKYSRGTRERKRVVVTGIGAVTPLGLTMEETWKNALAGKSGIAPITRFDTSNFDVKFAGEVKGFQPDLFIEKKEQKKMDAFIHYAVAATKMALENAHLKIDDSNAERIGCFIGVGMGGLPIIEEQFEKFLAKGPGRISPFFIPAVITNLAAGQVSIMLGMKGPNYSVTSACATGAHSIGEAARWIEDGKIDMMVAGGTEATVCRMAIGGFNAMTALSTRNDAPERASRPWDKDRDGFVLSEGSAVVILESLEHAEKRGANILCEVTGYGATSDAYHMTGMAPEGAGGAAAMTMAMKDAGLNPDQIQYVNAHGTSTPLGDVTETQGIKKAFGEHAKKLWVSSTKSMTGHTLGAAGAIESAFCVYALKHQIVPPTINLENPGEGCDLDYVPNKARDGKILNVLNNSFGFGGTNACLIFSKL